MPPPNHYGLRFDCSSMAIAVAVDDLSVVLESTLLSERELQRGELVRPLADSTREVEYVGHYLVHPHRQHRYEAFETFKAWLLDALGIREEGGIGERARQSAHRAPDGR